ncbi:MAG: DUF1385 domain-containing protein [Eubacteriales bacterium]|nr:DUF1385 domain-containing protein [Eubacteriales bacterium]
MKYSGIGGQAVIEGIMMRNGDRYSVAVRKPDGEIAVEVTERVPLTSRYKIASLPFIRGSFSFAESLIVGMKTLMFSASFYEDDEGEEPGRFEQWLEKTFGDKLDKLIMTVSLILSVIIAMVVFMWLPLAIAGVLKKFIVSDTLIALLEGLIRVMIFIIYIKLISRTEDIRRTFMYHGAEHKCINCIEHGMELNVDNVAVSSKEHKRCGTSFIVIVMIISILFFMVVRFDSPIYRLLSRIVLLPVIAGVSYEFLRIAGRSESKLVDILSRPGMWMQGLTTHEPDDSMIEVAIAAVNAIFDWRAYQKEEFPDGPDALGKELLIKAGARHKDKSDI